MRGEAARRDRRDRAHVDQHAAGAHRFREPARPEQHRLDVGRIGQHGDDDPGLGDALKALAVARARRHRLSDRGRIQVVNDDVEPGLEEVSGHRAAHHAETHETNELSCH